MNRNTRRPSRFTPDGNTDELAADELEADDSPGITRTRAALWIGAVVLVVIASIAIVAAMAGMGPKASKKVSLPKSVATQQGSDPHARCGQRDLKVSAHTDALTYAGGVKPKFSLSVENTGASPCVANLGTGSMRFDVRPANESDAKKAVWRSTDCQKEADDRYVILQPKSPLATDPLEWDRSRSAKDTCDKARPPVPAGAYDLHVEIAGSAAPQPAQFLLGD